MGYSHTEDITLMRTSPTEVCLGHCAAGLSVLWDVLLLSHSLWSELVRGLTGTLALRRGLLKTPSSALPRPGEHGWANFPLDQGLIWAIFWGVGGRCPALSQCCPSAFHSQSGSPGAAIY